MTKFIITIISLNCKIQLKVYDYFFFFCKSSDEWNEYFSHWMRHHTLCKWMVLDDFLFDASSNETSLALFPNISSNSNQGNPFQEWWTSQMYLAGPEEIFIVNIFKIEHLRCIFAKLKPESELWFMTITKTSAII